MALPRTNNDEKLQCFAPNRIESTQVFSTVGVVAIRLSAESAYTINASGVTATMPAGVTAIADKVATLDFVATTVIEVMDA